MDSGERLPISGGRAPREPPPGDSGRRMEAREEGEPNGEAAGAPPRAREEAAPSAGSGTAIACEGGWPWGWWPPALPLSDAAR